MQEHPHRYLALAPGLGKTPITAVAMQQLGVKTALIVVPKRVKETWRCRLVEWGAAAPQDIQVIEAGCDYPKAPIIIVNKELIVRSKPLVKALRKRKFDLGVIDEGHQVKEMLAQTTRYLIGRTHGEPLLGRCYRKWILSGTPAPNRLFELYPILKVLWPESIEPFKSKEDFVNYFCDGDERYTNKGKTAELAQRVSGFMRRRELEDVLPELPPVLESEVYIDVGEMLENESNTPLATLQPIVGMAKLKWCLDYLLEWLSTNTKSKALIYAFNSELIDNLQLGLAKFGARKLYGKQTESQKTAAVDAFMKDKDCRVLVAQRDVIGTAVDGLQHVCNHLFFVQIDWSDGGWDQQIGRLRRFGQTLPVYVTVFIAEKTLDQITWRTYKRKHRTIQHFYKNMENGEMAEQEMTLEQAIRSMAKSLAVLADRAAVAYAAGVQDAKSGNGKSDTKVEKEAAKEAVEKFTKDQLKAVGQETLKALGETAEARSAISDVIAAVTDGKAKKINDVSEKQFAAVAAGLKKLQKDGLPEAAKEAEEI